MTPLSLDDAQRVVQKFVEEYNTQRLHSAIGYVTPHDMLDGRQQAIFDERDRKVEEARERRAESRAAQRTAKLAEAACKLETPTYTGSVEAEDRALVGTNPSAASMPLTSADGVLSASASISAAVAV